MSKGLEAWERVELYCENNSSLEHLLDDLEIIEQELKEYEKMKAINGTTTFDKAIEDTLINACPNVAKKLKALEIIKNKGFHKPMLRFTESVEEYNFYNDDQQLTQEEYGLLKEVLL